MSAFEELGVMPEIITALEEMDWNLPTPVQTEAVPLILGGGDLAVAAETGSGKTGAFCLPIVQIVHEQRRASSSPNSETITEVDDAEPIALSTEDRGRNMAVDSRASVCQCRLSFVWEGVRATRPVASGKWYFVGCMRDEGISRLGWSSRQASLILGTDRRGFGYGGTATKSHGGKFDPYGLKFSRKDNICCMIEFIQKETPQDSTVNLSYMKNEQTLGVAFSHSFADLGLENLQLYPALAMRNAEVCVDFSATSEKAEKLGFRPVRDAKATDAVVASDVKAWFSDVDEGRGRRGGKASEICHGSGEDRDSPLALILEPSRELAGQVHEELRKFRTYLPEQSVRMLLLTGGGGGRVGDKALLRSGLDIVAGTLGSIVKHVKAGTLSLENIRFFVLDEADTFATDNFGDISFLHQKVPIRNRVQTLLFSATLHSPEILKLSEKIQSFPTWVDLKGKESVPETVHHTMVILDANADQLDPDAMQKNFHLPLDKVHQLKAISKDADMDMEDASDERSLTIKKLKLNALLKTIEAHSMNQAMIFVRTQLDGDNVESFLLQCSGVSGSAVPGVRFKRRRDSGPEFKYSCAVLHGGRRQEDRNAALAAFKAGEVRFLICTDVASRGIDIAGLPYLINMTLPDQSENYIHRVGRVGRAERLGLAISFIGAQREAVWFHQCTKAKGGTCKNRKLVSAGGCVMWQNEMKMLQEIENRLKGRVEELGADFRRKDENARPILYGERIGEEAASTQTGKHIEELQPAVRELVRLEEDAQASFFSLQSAYKVR